MKSIIISGILLTSFAFSNIQKAPENFNTKKDKAVFADFINQITEIKYDIRSKEVLSTSRIKLQIFEEGKILFDLKSNVLEAKINGVLVNTHLINSPGNVTSYNIVDKVLAPGIYELSIKNKITNNISFSRNSVQSAFWMSDLNDRRYLENYIPSNLEYDQYQLNLNISVIGKNISSHEVFTNGELSNLKKNQFQIKFPKTYSPSSYYMHLSSANKFKKIEFSYKSINKKVIPITIYSRNEWRLNRAKAKTLTTLKELERKLGPWEHKSFIAYIAGRGGMEHSGATITSMSALEHEITHSYFARGVMPSDGNSGWLDEAIASWRDKGYKSVRLPSFNSSNMSGQSQYKRTTDRRAYKEGAEFMAFLNSELKNDGGLIVFLSYIYKKYVHKKINTKLFLSELNSFSGRDYTTEFNQYIFGISNVNSKESKVDHENPFHPKLTKKELLQLL